MPVEWLAGYTHRYVYNQWPPRRRQLGRAHNQPVRKVVIHTTEGSSAFGAFGAYDQRAGRVTGGVHPHFTVDPFRRERYQHVPLTRASYSLKGGDRDGVIQIEIVGWADHDWTDAQLEWLGSDVLAPIFAACPLIPREAPVQFLSATAGYLARPWPNGLARLSPTAWATTHGVLGHQHAPFDDHWDPGGIDIDRILAAADTPTTTPTPTYFEDPEMQLITDPEAQRAFLVWTGSNADTGTPIPVVREYGDYRGDDQGVSTPGAAYIIDQAVAAGEMQLSKV